MRLALANMPGQWNLMAVPRVEEDFIDGHAKHTNRKESKRFLND